MPYLPLSNPPPSVPAVLCRDGRYWSGARTRRRATFPCAPVEVRSLTVAQVAATYEGDAQSRAAQLAALTEGQRLALYPPACLGCGQNHAVNAANLVRAWRAVHPSVRAACEGLPTAAYIALAALVGETPAETAQLQALAAARHAFRRAG